MSFLAFQVAHHQLLAHAAAVAIYRSEFQEKQKGKIGLALDSQYYYPVTNSSSDVAAAHRGMEFAYGWFAGNGPWLLHILPTHSLSPMPLLAGASAHLVVFVACHFCPRPDPVQTGDYPPSMRQYVSGGRLPTFTPQQQKQLKGSADFLGINIYT